MLNTAYKVGTGCAIAASISILWGGWLGLTASTNAQKICDAFGGLQVKIATERSPRLFAELAPTTLSKSDAAVFDHKSIFSDGFALDTWPKASKSLLRCSHSVACQAILETSSFDIFVDYDREADRYSAITAVNSPFCSAASLTILVPSGEFERTGRPLKLLGKRCLLDEAMLRKTLFISRPFVSKMSASIFSDYIAFRGWRVYQLGKSDPVISYTQAGSVDVVKKSFDLLPNLMGIFDDRTGSRCGYESADRGQTAALVHFFDRSANYPVGSFKNGGDDA